MSPAWVRPGWSNTCSPCLPVTGGPGQLMGTRTCQGLRPPLSAAATALEPAGALRSPAAPASPAPGPALGSCLEKQAGGGSDSTALGCSSSCCSLTGFPRPPTPCGIAPSHLSSPLWGFWLLACSPALALPPTQCWPHHQEPVLCSPLESRQGPSVAQGTHLQCQASFSCRRDFCLPEASPDLCSQHRGHLTVLHLLQNLKLERQQSSGEEGLVGYLSYLSYLSYPSYFKKSFQSLCICSCLGRMFIAGSSSPLVQPGQDLWVLLWKGEHGEVGTTHGHPQPLLPCTTSQIISAESHPRETVLCQSLSYVLPILLWLTQIKSSEGTVSAQRCCWGFGCLFVWLV